MSKKRKKKRHTGRVILSLTLIVLAIGLFLGKDALTDALKTKAAQFVAKKMLEEQLRQSIPSENPGADAIDASKIVDQMDTEDLQKATEIAEKYIDSGNIGKYVEMVADGNLSELKEQVQNDLSEADQQTLLELYEKYKGLVP